MIQHFLGSVYMSSKALLLVLLPVFASHVHASMVASASYEEGLNTAENVRDGNVETRWAAPGEGQWLQLDLGRIKTVSAIKLAFDKGDQRKSYFSVQVSLDNKHWVTLMSEMESSGTTKFNERFDFDSTRARYIRYIGYGNSQSNWNALTKVSIVSSSYSSD